MGTDSDPELPRKRREYPELPGRHSYIKDKDERKLADMRYMIEVPVREFVALSDRLDNLELLQTMPTYEWFDANRRQFKSRRSLGSDSGKTSKP